MIIPFDALKDKIKGCWTGKNIGGVLGAPFEGFRQINNVEFYTQDLSGNPPPNDDLDLQLVWLNAVERFGRNVNASILGEYWLSYITPDWVEYGTGKSNMRAGFLPPLSGHLSNKYENSCGCFIRSEIWACIAPGRPELAVRYAYEDAIVDHAHEGMYAEIFCAAIESAAFVENDKYRLIDIGLSYIPSTCAICKAVHIVMEAYKEGVPFTEARRRVMTEVPGNFGIQFTKIKDIKEDFPHGDPGFDAPSNIGLMIIGWLYGQDDFAKSLCIAVNCGEDTDCTAATLGAIMGIIQGDKLLPKEWKAPLGGKISTCCIDLSSGIRIPATVDQLTERILKAIPAFLNSDDISFDGTGYSVTVLGGDELLCPTGDTYIQGVNGNGKPKELQIDTLLKLSPYGVHYTFTAFNVIVDYIDEPVIRISQPKKVKLRIYDNGVSPQQKWVNVKLYSRENVIVTNGYEFSTPLQNTYKSTVEVELEIVAESFNGPRVEVIADITIVGRHSNGIVKIALASAM